MISLKLRLLFGIVFALGMISLIGMTLEESQAQKTQNEIIKNEQITVNDEVSKTIKIKLHDGISSSDEIR